MSAKISPFLEGEVLTDKGLAERRRQCVREEEHGHNEGPHVPRRLGERILKTSDRREDLAERDEDVGSCLDPDVQGRSEWVAVSVRASGSVVPTWAGLWFATSVVIRKCGEW